MIMKIDVDLILELEKWFWVSFLPLQLHLESMCQEQF